MDPKDADRMANSVDPGLGLNYLPRPISLKTYNHNSTYQCFISVDKVKVDAARVIVHPRQVGFILECY